MMSSYHQFSDRRHPEHYRESEIKQLSFAVRARENRLLLALPGMGVSNLLRFFVSQPERFMPKQTAVCYVNLGTLPDKPEPLFAEIARQLAEQRVGKGVAGTVEGYQRLYQLLLAANHQSWQRLVLAIDQADGLLTASNHVFYRQLKALTDLNKSVAVLLAASWRLAPQIDPDDLLFAGRRLFIGPLAVADFAHAVTEEGQRLDCLFSSVQQQQLAWLTGRCPGLLRAVSTVVCLDKIDVTEGQTAVSHLLRHEAIGYRCQKIWRELTEVQQQSLQRLAANRKADEEILGWLARAGLIALENGRWQIFSPIFRQFVLNKDPILLPIKLVNPSVQQYKKKNIVVAAKVFRGNQEIAVSPLELRLIACLKQEKKIYSKDDIAAYVYYEDWENFRDITNNRVENLIRQVRRKLGGDYIIAHWGRGYELVA